MSYKKQTASHIYYTAQGKANKLIEVDSLRAILLDASQECILSSGFNPVDADNYFSVMCAGVEQEYGVATQLLYRDYEGHKFPKATRVALWQHKDGDITAFWAAVQATKLLTDYLGLSRYNEDMGVISKDSTASKSFKTEVSSSVSVLMTNGVIAAKQALTAILSSGHTESGNKHTEYAATGIEPSTVMLKMVQEKLGLPTPVELMTSVGPRLFGEMCRSGDFSRYEDLAVAELQMDKMAKGMIGNVIRMQGNARSNDPDSDNYWRLHKQMSSEQIADLELVQTYLDGGYTKDALDYIQCKFPPSRPPEAMDWIYHIVLYSALCGGARRMIDVQIGSILEQDNEGMEISVDHRPNKAAIPKYKDTHDRPFLDKYPGFIGVTDTTVVIRPNALPQGNTAQDATLYDINRDYSNTPAFMQAAILSSDARYMPKHKNPSKFAGIYDITGYPDNPRGNFLNISDSLLASGLGQCARKLVMNQTKSILIHKDSTDHEKVQAARLLATFGITGKPDTHQKIAKHTTQ
jgi:hypothetical protein